MSGKYWVPALGKANQIMEQIARDPGRFKLIDLSKRLDIHKSSMFSLLQTMEQLQWVVKEPDDTYSIGPAFGTYGSIYFRQFDLVRSFMKEGEAFRDRLGETIQLARRDEGDCVYLAKLEAPSPVRLLSEPGMKLPCYATALGKVLLSDLTEEQLVRLYPERLEPLTARTLRTREQLSEQLASIRRQGYAIEEEEIVEGFCCVAAPVRDATDRLVAAVSYSVPTHRWQDKLETAIKEIRRLGRRLSFQVEKDVN